LPKSAVYSCFRKSQIKLPKQPRKDKGVKKDNLIKCFGLERSNGVLTYRLANQIYEAQDLGFKEDEIEELLDISKEVRDYALLHRELIQTKRDKIVSALKL
jgi:hypothetical protein